MVHAEDMVFFLSAFQYLCVLGSSLVLRVWCLLVVICCAQQVPGSCALRHLSVRNKCVLSGGDQEIYFKKNPVLI